MENNENQQLIRRMFWNIADFDGFEKFCECMRRLDAAAIVTDGERSRPFVARSLFTCHDSAVVCDDDWNCVAYTERNLLAVRPVSNDYNVFTFEIETACEVFPRLDAEDEERHVTHLSLWLPGDKHEVKPRSDDESYRAYDVGLNRLFTAVYDLDTLGWFCDAVMATLEASSDEDDAMVLLSINARVQDPMAQTIPVNSIAYNDGVLTLSAEDENGDEMLLALTPSQVGGVERVSMVNNCFYCLQIELESNGAHTTDYLQLAFFL